MLRKLALGALVVVAALALYVATRPAEFHIERATTIAAPPERIFPLVNDFRAWPRWSPYERKDPSMTRMLGGAESGVGATYAWDGNEDVGAGRMMITESVPERRIGIRLEFLRPMTATNEVAFVFEPVAEGTRVVWGMDGRNGFLGKLAALLLDVDAMVGADFEAGLAALRSAAEAEGAPVR